LPIQKGFTVTGCRGPSSLERPDSLSGLPIKYEPPGIGTMSNFTSESGIFSVYAFCVIGSTLGKSADKSGNAGALELLTNASKSPANRNPMEAGCCISRFIYAMLQLCRYSRPCDTFACECSPCRTHAWRVC